MLILYRQILQSITTPLHTVHHFDAATLDEFVLALLILADTPDA